MTGTKRPLRYVALGDSYTIGTAVSSGERWPDQLVRALDVAGAPIELVANLAVNGYTTGDVINDELPRLEALRPEFASLLIGVNDVVQGVGAERYRSGLRTILDDLTGRLPVDRILLVTTPDYTVTPAGADFGDPDERRSAIVEVNAILVAEAEAQGLAVVDIFDISSLAGAEPALVAADGLHPSGAQYARWVERIAPVVAALF